MMYIQQEMFVKVKDNVIRDLHHTPHRQTTTLGGVTNGGREGRTMPTRGSKGAAKSSRTIDLYLFERTQFRFT